MPAHKRRNLLLRAHWLQTTPIAHWRVMVLLDFADGVSRQLPAPAYRKRQILL
jgi:hypothetical protein